MKMDSVGSILTLIERMNSGKLVIPGAGDMDVPTIEDLMPDSPLFESEDNIPTWVRTIVVARDGEQCVFDGRSDTEIHHLITRAIGDHNPDALITLCLKHHRGFMHQMGQEYDYAPYVQLDPEE